jgi:hypothetical protein
MSLKSFPGGPPTFLQAKDAFSSRINNSISLEAQALFAAMTDQPTATRKNLINTLIVGLKNSGVWTGLDCLFLLAAADSQAALLNWKTPATPATAVNSPAFVADRGYTGDVATSYINSNFNPFAGGVNFVQNSGSQFVHCGTNIGNGAQTDVGMARALTISRSGTDTLTTRGNANSGLSSGTTVTSSIGGFGWSRSNSADYIQYQNSVALATQTQASTAIIDENAFICARSAGASPTAFSGRQISAFYMGRNLTQAEVTSTHTLVKAYLDAVGAPTT